VADEMIHCRDRAKLKQGLVKVLQCVASISSAAAVVNPIFGVAGSLIRVVLHHVDDEDIRTLRRGVRLGAPRAGPACRSRTATRCCRSRRRRWTASTAAWRRTSRTSSASSWMMVEARPEQRLRRKDDFEESYANDLGDQNLHTLYDGVVGKPKLFSRPVAGGVLKHCGGERRVMERLCTRLSTSSASGLSEEWEALRRCK
uniref:Rapunzel n=1 Tax=Salarias fasciatus TaxID=181472 RepID=A0A672I003_SALFA